MRKPVSSTELWRAAVIAAAALLSACRSADVPPPQPLTYTVGETTVTVGGRVRMTTQVF